MTGIGRQRTFPLVGIDWAVGSSIAQGLCHRHSRRAMTIVLAVTVMVLTAGVRVARAAEGCANEAIRTEQGAAALALPDCRAYEMVSPPGSVPASASNAARPIASASGERFGYYAYEPFPGSEAEGLYLLATRGSSGWSVQNVTPPQGGVDNSEWIACFPSVFYAAELTAAVLVDGWNYINATGAREQCEGDAPPLVAGEPRGYANLFVRDNEDGSYEFVNHLREGAAPANALFWDATPDLGRVVFSEAAELTPEAAPGAEPNLYESVDGSDRLLTFLPDGEPVHGALANSAQGSATYTHAVSANGETVFFDAGGDLYARLNAGQASAAGGACSTGEPDRACTVQIDAAVAGAPGPGGGGVFADASEDGSRVFFTDEHRLTSDATALASQPDLYEYDLETGSLTDLTVSASGVADVLGYSGASADGSYVYFVAKGVLTGEQVNREGSAAVLNKPNLYLLHAGVTTFIGTLKEGQGFEGDDYDWGNNSGLTARVSPNGQYLAFNSVAPLTGYANQPLEPQDCGKRCSEIFLYNAVENQLSCVSCAPSGELPSGPARIPLPTPELLTPEPPLYLARDVLNDGRVFFETRTPLVPQAINGEVNVYEYENGEPVLISNGSASAGSVFLDASADGSDVFFATGDGLVAGDTDNQVSVYDARVNGGFPPGAGEAEQVPACESAEACKPPPSEAPAQLFPASSALAGGGDLVAPPVPITPSPPPVEKPTAGRSLTRAQKLARALAACARRPRSRRAACRATARRRFGVEPAQRGRAKNGKGGATDVRFGDSEGRAGR